MTMRKRRRWRAALLLVPVLGFRAAAPIFAAPAVFWVSTSGTIPDAPGVAEFVSAANVPRRLHIWAQPRTLVAGAWHPTTNPFLTFQNVSLDVVSPQSSFSIDPDTIDVYNPLYSTGKHRYTSVSDSTTGLTESTGAEPGTYDDLPSGFSKGLLDLQGYSVPPADADGFGVACDSIDSYCATTSAGSDAWLFASFTVTPSASSGVLEFSLQIGLNGMNHVGEGSGDMLVEFGVDTQGLPPADYDPEFDRKITFADDDRDAVLTLSIPGDYDGDGDVDATDYTTWKTDFGTHSYDSDGNGDATVNLADYTIWRDHLQPPPAAFALTRAVPEPTSRAIVLLLAAILPARFRRPLSPMPPSGGG